MWTEKMDWYLKLRDAVAISKYELNGKSCPLLDMLEKEVYESMSEEEKEEFWCVY